jgi:DNA-binding beta-propeller fold protein YncE
MRQPIVAAASAVILASGVAHADIAVSSNDGHTVLRNGVQVTPSPVLPDTLSIIELSGEAPRITATIEVPGSVVGPPFAVWVAPDASWCIVTAATKADAGNTGGISPDNRVSVVDLAGEQPRIVQSLTAGTGATGVRVSPDGTLALVANRAEGTVSIFTVADKRLTPAGKVDFGSPKGGASGVGFTRDGRAALVSRDFDDLVSVLHIDGAKVTVDPRPISTGVRPYSIDINAAGTLAAVSNVGRGDGDLDTISLIDLTSMPFHTVETVAVVNGPEGLKFSPDGRFLAVQSQDGSQKAPGATFQHDRGILVMFAVNGDTNHGIGPGQNHLTRVAEAPIGGWAQGIAFSRDGRTVLLQGMAEQKIQVFKWDGSKLTEGAALPIKGGPAAIATPWP